MTAWCALGLALAAAGGTGAQEAAFSEDEVKAASLYHFGSYVEWPSPGDAQVTIGVLGAEGVVEQLEIFLPERTIQGRPVEVRRLESLAEIDGVEVIFIGQQHNSRLDELLEQLADAPVLTVTHSADGLDRGAIVNFQIVEERVRFEISVTAAERAGLTLSSRLLSAALRVRTSSCKLDCRRSDALREVLHAGLRGTGRFGTRSQSGRHSYRNKNALQILRRKSA